MAHFHFFISILLIVIISATTGCHKSLDYDSTAIKTLIQAAGNANSDEHRLAILKELQKRDLPYNLKNDLNLLVASIEKWTYGEILSYYHTAGDFQYTIDAHSPLYPILTFYQARGMVWVQVESAFIFASGASREKERFLSDVRHKFEVTRNAFPQNTIARMYLGEAIPSRQILPEEPQAPRWAIYTREAIERCNYLFEWWVDNRLNWQGEYRGGEDDDCEMWRTWAPVLIGFDNPKLTQAERLFCRSLLNQPFVKRGYSDRAVDVEHTSEPTTDTLTPMLHLEPREKEWINRTLRILDLMEKRWTGINERGFLQFKSVYFTSTKVNADPNKTCDTPRHFSAVIPILLYWQRTGDTRCREIISSWLNTWTDASLCTDGGKPAGILPAAIHWPDGRTCGTNELWWDPQCHPKEPTLYQWPMGLSHVTHALVLGHYMTGESSYLDPIRSLVALRLKYLDEPNNPEKDNPGTSLWAASQDIGLCCSSAAAKYRFLLGDTCFDDYLKKEGSTYILYRVNPTPSNFDHVIDSIEKTARVLRYNTESHTSEARFTDRFFSDRFNKMLPKDSPLYNTAVDAELLYNAVTGDPGGVYVMPLNAVRWMTPPKNLGVFVTDSIFSLFNALLYNFEDQDRRIDAEFYLLKPGLYTARVISDSKVESEYELEVTGRITPLTFTLPSRQECRLNITPKND